MKVAIFSFDGEFNRAHPNNHAVENELAQLVLVFGDKKRLANRSYLEQLQNSYPNAALVFSSTAGEIFDAEVNEGSISTTVIQFEHSSVASVCININTFTSSFSAGEELVKRLSNENSLKYVLLIADGALVNGSELVKAVNQSIPAPVLVTGGLAGDGNAFESTAVGLNELPTAGNIVAIGFYGNRLQVSHGSMGGYETFGPERPVTKSAGNRLFEINNQSALQLYKTYLGSYAAELPGSAFLFPLQVRLSNGELVVRTILSIDNATDSMVFAGDIPQNAMVRFMKANFDRIINAAGEAASMALRSKPPELALLISCVGRKIILESRTVEEIEAVKDVYGTSTLLSGFYSYGEISPVGATNRCELHNQTMTITCFSEW